MSATYRWVDSLPYMATKYVDLEDEYGAYVAWIQVGTLEYSIGVAGLTRIPPDGITDLPTVMAYVETLVRLEAR